MTELKAKILEEIEKILSNKVKDMQKQLADLQNDSAGSAKSSMGDKYETTREMLKQEENKIGQQLARAKKDLQLVLSLKKVIHQEAQLGSLVKANQKFFMLLIGVGAISVAGEEIFVISPASPIGQTLLGKKNGEVFTFNKQAHKIDCLT